MKYKNMIDLRLQLKSMSSQELESLFREETEKETSDYDMLLTILHILEERTNEAPVDLTPEEEKAWENYRKRVTRRIKEPVNPRAVVLKVACVLLVIGMLFYIVPQQVEADGFWDRIARWSDEFFAFFNPNAVEKSQDGYVFQTDNEGLQQVYDAVVELGITEPVVPMWLPEGYELVECKVVEEPGRKYVCALFCNGIEQFIFKTATHMIDIQNQYPKNEAGAEFVELHGIKHSVVRNDNLWTVIWVKEQSETYFTVDCQEDILNEILKSIYMWGHKK